MILMRVIYKPLVCGGVRSGQTRINITHRTPTYSRSAHIELREVESQQKLRLAVSFIFIFGGVMGIFNIMQTRKGLRLPDGVWQFRCGGLTTRYMISVE